MQTVLLRCTSENLAENKSHISSITINLPEHTEPSRVLSWRGSSAQQVERGPVQILHSRHRSFSCHKITHQKHLSIPNEAENFPPPSHTHTLHKVLTSYMPIQSSPPLFHPRPRTDTNELQSVLRINERDLDRPAM